MKNQTQAERGCERCNPYVESRHPRVIPLELRRPAEPALWAGGALVIVVVALAVAVIVAQLALAVLR